MTLVDDELLRDLVAEAALAPSVQNVQPARWAGRDDRVVLLRALDRVLPVADPTGQDVRISLGAAFEGLALAASARGLAVRDAAWGEAARAAVGAAAFPGHEVVATARLAMAGIPDPLAAYARARRSWRGAFRAGSAAVKALAAFRDDDAFVVPASAAGDVARWNDAATWELARRAGYQAERLAWLRLDASDPRYRRDGVTAETLLLSPMQRRLARVALQPPVFRMLQATGLARALVSETAATLSAAGFVCFAPERALDDYAAGRRFYRLWLRATAAGLALAPMPPLTAHEATQQLVAERAAVPAARRLVYVLRAGRCPVDAPPASPRLPVEELLVGA